jgi:molybdopterin-dependent oxidoreductase alpha subunit
MSRPPAPVERHGPRRRWAKPARRIAPDLWVGLKPNGIGEIKPNHYLEMAQTVWENRRHPGYAWRVLSKGVCDGCALGVAGFHDWTISGVHLCTIRLNLLQLNTMDAFDPSVMSDVSALESKSATELRALGRIPYPFLRRHGETAFRRISWDEALKLAADRIKTSREAGPDRIAFYLTSRGLTNEVYYVAQKVARFLGTNNIDNAARICHSPSTGGLKRSLGAAATTVSYSDVVDSDLIVLHGTDVANAQPVFMKYLYMARKRGTKVVVINPYREPGLERYWIPSNLESALVGCKMSDDLFQIHTGGDIAFNNGALKALIDSDGVDQKFIDEHGAGWDELKASLDKQSYEDLERWSGASRADMKRFADIYAAASSAIHVWAMGITQHACGSDNVQSVINLGLARGNVGRQGAGFMPIRGHSGVQGGAEMGAYATVFPGGTAIGADSAAALSEQYGFPIPDKRGLSAAEMVEAAGRGEIDVLWSSGGNFLDTLPDPNGVYESLGRVPMRVHQDIVLSPQMLVDSGEATLILPAATRYEQPGGGTETTTERRILYNPEIKGHRVGEARSEWQIFLDLAAAVDPERAATLCDFRSGQAIREEIAKVVPYYDGIQNLRRSGDAIQWGGPRLCEGWKFQTPDGKAHFVPVTPVEAELPEGAFRLSTRRGKQFNSMIIKKRDPLTGADRDALFMAATDASAKGLADGDRVRVKSEAGEIPARIKVSDIRPGNVQMFFPEANALVKAGQRDPVALVPDYNATVTIEPA